MKINQKLILLRKEKGWSQEELANQLHISRQAVSKWELGESVPDTNNLLQLSKIYGKSIDDLLENESSQKQKNRKQIIKIVLIIISSIIIIYLGYSLLIYSRIATINDKFSHHSVLSNYYFKIYDYEIKCNNILEEKTTEVYYKEGVCKKIVTQKGMTSIMYTNFNTGESLITKEETKTISKLDSTKQQNGTDIGMLNPSIVYCDGKKGVELLLAFSPKLNIKVNEKEYKVTYEDHTIWIDKETGLPNKSTSIDSKTNQEHRRRYEFYINQTQDSQIEKIDTKEYTFE